MGELESKLMPSLCKYASQQVNKNKTFTELLVSKFKNKTLCKLVSQQVNKPFASCFVSKQTNISPSQVFFQQVIKCKYFANCLASQLTNIIPLQGRQLASKQIQQLKQLVVIQIPNLTLGQQDQFQLVSNAQCTSSSQPASPS